MHAITLISPAQGRATFTWMWEWAKPRLAEGKRLRMSIGEDKRSLPQNAKLHALLGEIEKQKEWAGQKWGIEDWKRLLTAAWMRANGMQAQIVPALDGQGFDVLYRHTSELDKAECSELLEYVQAWAATNGVSCAD